MKFYKLMFFSMVLIGTLISMSSYSWMTMWMGLEINLLSIIPLLSNTKNILSTESAMKYFITQAMASMILLMAVIMMLSNESFIYPPMNPNYLMIINSALLTKMGAAPFHFWFPEIMEGLTWMNSLLILTWQKIAPMMIMMMNPPMCSFTIFVIIISLMTSTLLAFNQMSMRKILAYSSINHIAWMLSAMMMSTKMWALYFSIYFFMNMSIILVLNYTKTFYLNQMFLTMNQNKISKMILPVMFLSMGGLPPFIGFLPKWIIVNWMNFNSMNLTVFIMIFTTIIMLFVYIRVMTTYFLLTSESKLMSFSIKGKVTSYWNSMLLVSLVLSSLIPLIY